MNLYDRLPWHVTVDGRTYTLRPSFDRVLQALDVMGRADITADQKIQAVCYLLIEQKKIHDPTRVALAAVQVLCPFSASKSEKVLDFQQDAEYIYAAFLQAYGIDLFRCQDRPGNTQTLHWWQFTALLASLPSDTRLSEIVGIRARPMPAPTAHNAEERQALQQLKLRYQLKTDETAREERLQDGLRKVAQCLLALAENQK